VTPSQASRTPLATGMFFLGVQPGNALNSVRFCSRASGFEHRWWEEAPMLKRMVVIAALGTLWNSASMLHAQWVNYPTPGIPRWENGRPNLEAPTPRTTDVKPNISGIWQVAKLLPCDDVRRVCTDLPISQQFGNIGAGLPGGLPYQPAVKEKMSAKG